MTKALPAGRPQGRPLFGLLDPHGWGWATVKATFWLLVIIVALGYIPDRAYYFVVSRTIDLGIVGWAPVNLCPPENGTDMPCPVPLGATLPWQDSPADLALPTPRTDGAAAQLGSNLLYIGGSDGTAPSATVYVSTLTSGTFGPWSEGPALPEARTDAALAVLSGTAYLLGGIGPDGQATDTVWSIGLDPETGALGTWAPVEGLTLPEARSGAAATGVADGIVVAGGAGPTGAPTATVWKSTLDPQGKLAAFTEEPALFTAVTDASMVLEGTFLWVYGGTGAGGAVATVQRGDYGPTPATASAAPGATAPPGPDGVLRWAILDAANLPALRTDAAGFSANGALYLIGGTDGTTASADLYWALPTATGEIEAWNHLAPIDLPAARAGAAPVVTGATALLIGGMVDGRPASSAVRTSLAPQAPFFQAGLVGVVVPALQIGGQIGQQLGYLAAAGVGTGNFVLLVIVGVAFNHKPQIRAWWDRRKAAREARAPKAS